MIRKTILLFFLAGLMISAQQISVSVKTDSSAYLIGDYINYTLTIAADDKIEFSRPEFPDTVKNLVILKKNLPEKSNDKKDSPSVYKYLFSVYDSADVTIPPVAVKYKIKGVDSVYTIYSDSLSIKVNKIPVKAEAEIKDIKPPVKIPLDWTEIILWTLGIILLIMIIGFLIFKYWKNRKGIAQEIKEPEIPAHEEALRKLRNLESMKLWQSGEIKQYHSAITEIIRSYFEKRYGIAALELTSAEILTELEKFKDTELISSSLREFFETADMVKFAKFIPLAGVNEKMMELAVNTVNHTIPPKTYQSGVNNAE